MIYMHCSIRVADFRTWQTKMYADIQSQLDAGLKLIHLWRSVDNPNQAFMLLEVSDQDKAAQHLNPSDVKRSADAAGVLEFSWCFVQSVDLPRMKPFSKP